MKTEQILKKFSIIFKKYSGKRAGFFLSLLSVVEVFFFAVKFKFLQQYIIVSYMFLF